MLTVHGDGSAARDFVFVRDVCDAVDRILRAPPDTVAGEVINLGSGRHRTILEIAEAIRARMGSDRPIEFVGDRPGQVFRHTADASKAGRLIGWRPATSFEEGLGTTIDWYRRHEAWWRRQIWMRKIPIVTAAGVRELH